MRKKRKNLFSKVVMILFMVMIVLGFTIPGFLQGNEGSQDSYATEEPRVCQTDAECYLDCGAEPVAVLCYQNLCQRNSCEGADYYPFTAAPTTFTLSIMLHDEEVVLENYANTQDMFVKFSGNAVESRTSGIALRHVLDKLNMAINAHCIQATGQHLCTGETGELKLLLNGEISYAAENLIPHEGDVIEIVFG